MGYQIVDDEHDGLKGTFTLAFYDAEGQPYTREITVLRNIGSGSSCICYEGLVRFDSGTEHKMIVKQFYPLPYIRETKVEQRGAELFIDGYEYLEEIQKLGDGFERAFEVQNRLANRKDLMEVLVRPYEKYFSGATKYILYEADDGKSMEKLSLGSDIRKLLLIVKEAAESLSCLHKQGILHMDLTPDNILWVHDKRVKFFDFDSVVELDKIEEVHKLRGKREFLAPELAKEQNFEQNKKLILKPQADIYSLGCILFFYIFQRYPSEEEMKHHGYKNELYHIVEKSYGKLFSKEQKKLLFHVIQHGIDYYIGKRYLAAEEMAADLQKVLRAFDGLEEEPGMASEINYTLFSGYILHKYPLFQYKNIYPDGSGSMDVTIVGTSALRDAFVKNIFSCAQMLDTKLIIRIIAEDIREYLHDLLASCPALGSVAEIYLEGKPYLENGNQLALDPFITKTAFASIYGYHMDRVEEVFPSPSNYYLLVHDDYEENYKLAEILGKAFHGRKQKVFIGCGYGRWKEETWKAITEQYSDLAIERIECNAVYTIAEETFQENIYKMARGVHTFYVKEWNETASEKDIWKDFKNAKNSHYNMKSSLRSALSIPYKLASCNIISNADPAGMFYQKVLSGSEEAVNNKNRLIYLEHRSWMCFMIMEGYRYPTEKELEEYFYQEGNDHRNMKEKLHPCICGCSPEKGLMLKGFTRKQWNSPAELKKEYDELDLQSLRLHQMCRKRKKELKSELEEQFAFFEKELLRRGLEPSYLEECQWLEVLLSKMMDEETNVNAAWEKESRQYLRHLKEASKELEDAFQIICRKMGVVLAANEYHDYKSSDATILDAVPRLLMEEPVRKIYKLVSEKNWENILSSIIIEPEELVLVKEEGKDIPKEEQQALSDFFTGRGLEKLKLRVVNWKELKITKSRKKFVVDITGAEESMLFYFLQAIKGKEVPVVCYRHGKLEELSGTGEIYYYNQKKSLTVESTFSLFWANVFSFKKENFMMDLGRNYQDLWNAYAAVKPFEWKIFIDLLVEWEKKNYWKIPKQPGQQAAQRKTVQTAHIRAMKDCGMDKVLDSMKRHGLIEQYKIPVEMGNISITTANPEIVKLMDVMLQKITAEPYQHKFLLKKQGREPMSGEVLEEDTYYIKDETNLVSFPFRMESVVNWKGVEYDKAEAVEKVLLSLYREGKKGKNETIIAKLPDCEMITAENDGTRKLSFCFFSQAVKECLLKEGNVLEQYVYHTIRQNTTLSDVKINVEFAWNAWNGEDDTDRNSITNEIDLVCCKGLKTYFISCKQSRPAKEFLNEIKYYADYFGIDAKAIIICSNMDRSYVRQMEHIIKRSDQMGVYFIDRSLIGSTKQEVSAGKLAKVIQNIVDGKEHWREV